MEVFEEIMEKLKRFQNVIETESEAAKKDYSHLLQSMMSPTEQNRKHSIKMLNETKQKYLAQIQISQKISFKKTQKRKAQNRLRSKQRITTNREQSIESDASSCSDSSSSSSSSIEILTQSKSRNASNHSNHSNVSKCSNRSNIDEKWKYLQEALNYQQSQEMMMTFNVEQSVIRPIAGHKQAQLLKSNRICNRSKEENESESDSDSDCLNDEPLQSKQYDLKQMESIEISDCESTPLSEMDPNAITPSWCNTKEKIIQMSKANRNTNPTLHFGDKRNLIIDVKKVLGPNVGIKKTSNWAKADLLSAAENKKYLKFMGWL